MSRWEKLTRDDWWPSNRDEVVVRQSPEISGPRGEPAFAIYGWRMPEVVIGRALVGLSDIAVIRPIPFGGGRWTFSVVELFTPLFPAVTVNGRPSPAGPRDGALLVPGTAGFLADKFSGTKKADEVFDVRLESTYYEYLGKRLVHVEPPA